MEFGIQLENFVKLFDDGDKSMKYRSQFKIVKEK